MAVTKILILLFAVIAAVLCDQPSERVKKQVVVAGAVPYAAGAYPYHVGAYPYAAYHGYPYAAYHGYQYPYVYAAYDDGKYYPGKYDVY